MPDAQAPLSAAWSRAVRCLQVDQWTAEVISEFQRRGIRAILLKGPVIARWLYAEDPSRRTYVDVDLLVAPTELERAGDALRAMAFISTVPLRPRHSIRKHADEWQRPADGAAVDLHIALHGTERAGSERVWQAVSEGTEHWDVAGLEVEVPGVVARTLHVVLNLQPDDSPSSQPAEDLARAVARVDLATWTSAVRMAERLGVTAEMGAGLARIPPGTLLADRLHLPTRELVHLFPISKNASVPLLSVWHFRTLPNARAQLQYLMDVLFPPPDFLRARWSAARRGRSGLAAGYVAWIGHCCGRGLWALLRYPSLRRQWHRHSETPADEGGPER